LGAAYDGPDLPQAGVMSGTPARTPSERSCSASMLRVAASTKTSILHELRAISWTSSLRLAANGRGEPSPLRHLDGNPTQLLSRPALTLSEHSEATQRHQ
jgi:hypothetical protein